MHAATDVPPPLPLTKRERRWWQCCIPVKIWNRLTGLIPVKTSVQNTRFPVFSSTGGNAFPVTLRWSAHMTRSPGGRRRRKKKQQQEHPSSLITSWPPHGNLQDWRSINNWKHTPQLKNRRWNQRAGHTTLPSQCEMKIGLYLTSPIEMEVTWPVTG